MCQSLCLHSQCTYHKAKSTRINDREIGSAIVLSQFIRQAVDVKKIYGMIVCVIPLLLHNISSLRPPKSVEVELENVKYIYTTMPVLAFIYKMYCSGLQVYTKLSTPASPKIKCASRRDRNAREEECSTIYRGTGI